MIRRKLMKRSDRIEAIRLEEAMDIAFNESMIAVLNEFDENGEWHPEICGCDREWLRNMAVLW